MTYYNGNPYAGPTESAPLDAWAHDGCLPADQFETVMLPDFTTGHTDPGTGYYTWDKVPHTQQLWPWHWSPIYGAANPCHYCGAPTEERTERGTWRATAPAVREVTA